MSRFADAVEKVRALPPERQELAAELLLNLVSGEHFAASLDESQLVEVETAKGEADAGDFATESEAVALWRKHGV